MEQVGVRDPLAGQHAERLGLTGVLDRQPDLQQPSFRCAYERPFHREPLCPTRPSSVTENRQRAANRVEIDRGCLTGTERSLDYSGVRPQVSGVLEAMGC